jgi:ribosomal protein S18 acetylase RimI-like enzyme
LGKACLGEATRLLKPTGFKKLQAEVKNSDQAAIRLFESSGFKTTRKLTRYLLPVK